MNNKCHVITLCETFNTKDQYNLKKKYEEFGLLGQKLLLIDILKRFALTF